MHSLPEIGGVGTSSSSHGRSTSIGSAYSTGSSLTSRWSSTTLSCERPAIHQRIHISDAFYDGPYFDPLSPSSFQYGSAHTLKSTPTAPFTSPRVISRPRSHSVLAQARRAVKAIGIFTQHLLRSRSESRDGSEQPQEYGESVVIAAHGPWRPHELISRDIAMTRCDIVYRPEGFEMRGDRDLFVYF